ncbi:MAG: heme lyase CcmF/NrfE family subunit [Alphaproteobacteria bacterium]|nr:heme lyase CcmF/NrfE family subunit [Alphaproteobacteria bacterium]
MISMLGRGLVMAALLFATFGSVMGFVAGARYSQRAWDYTRWSALAFGTSMIGANLLMVYALLMHDFSVAYVAQVGSTESPWYITVISLWSSLEGSILFWGGILAVYVLAMVVTLRKPEYREYAPWTLHVMMAIAVFFALLVSSIANPFAAVDPATLAMEWRMKGVPETGPGPNPLLQNHWLMAVHPPTLYLGYVGMAAPFSLIAASLLAGRLDAGWMGPVRRWMLVPWAFLSVGIVLGGWWSYAVLGWGGAWAWDPVENASFMPWLTGTAFLHSAMVLERRGLLRDWSLALGLSTFLLTMLGTFMTRSGVFNSVHSFTQSDIGPTFLAFIALSFCYSVVLLATRSHLLDRDDKNLGALSTVLGPNGELTADGVIKGVLGRDFTILVQNALFTVFTFTVLLGTTYPLLMEALRDRRISVGEPYFDDWATPLGIAIVFMMGVGPALPWGRTPPAQAARKLVPPAVFATVVALVTFTMMGWPDIHLEITRLVGMPMPILARSAPVFAIWVCAFALWANLAEFFSPVRSRMTQRGEGAGAATVKVVTRARRRFGGHIAHYGVIMAVFALTLSRTYRVEKDYNIPVGQSATFQAYEITFVGSTLEKMPHRDSVVARFDVMRGGSHLGEYTPKMNYFRGSRMGDPIWTPDVRSTPFGDLYFSLIEIPQDGKSVQVKFIERPFMMWAWFSAPLIFLGALIAAWPARRGRPATAPATVPAEGEPA